MINQIWTVLRKEFLDNFRDKRAMFNALFTVLFNPILYIFLFGFLNRSFSDQAERPLQLPIVGNENAPNLVLYLEQHNVTVLAAPDNPETAVRDGEFDAVLIIPAEYGEDFGAGRPAEVQLIVDETNQGSSVAVRRVRNLLGQYSGQIGGMRLLARGISPAIMRAVPVETVNVAPQSQAEASVVLNLLPVVMITAAFFGGFYLAVDMTAGERERSSLEPLFVNPVPRWRIFIGKFLTAFFFAALATFLATTLFLVLLGIPQIQEFTAIRINLGFDVIGTAVLLILPVVFMAVAVEMLVAAYARSIKEAQTYTQLVAMAGFLPAIFLSVLPIDAAGWMKLIPGVAQLFLINEVSRGEMLNPTDVLLPTLITLAIGFLAIRFTIRLYNQERVILGR